jgi:DNA repair exonuclease SbcCD ATPase subunit
LPEAEGPELAERLLRGNVILRQDALRDFINLQKMEKLRTLERLVGYETVGEARDALMQSVNALSTDQHFSDLKAEERTRWADLSALGMADFSQVGLLGAAAERLQVLGYTGEVSTEAQLTTAFEKLSGRYDLTDRQKKIGNLIALGQHLGTLGHIEQTQVALGEWTGRLAGLVSQSELAAAGLLENLYKAGLQVLDKGLGDPGLCPLCQEPTSRDSLKERLQREINSIAEAMTSWRDLRTESQKVSARLEREERALQQVIEGTHEEWTWVEPVSAALSAAHSAIVAQKDTLVRLSSSFPTEPPSWPSIERLRDLANQLRSSQSDVQTRLESLQVTEEERRRSQAIIDLSKLLTGYERLLPIRREIALFDPQLQSLRRALAAIEQAERTALQELLDAVSADVDTMYSALHPGEHISGIRLVQTPDRGVEFEVGFCDQRVSPPTRTLSESHLNCLGICLFLAVARRFATERGFVILDDVVRSIDSDHRRRLARLLRDGFSDTQFLLMTHDDLWFDMLKVELPQASWKSMETMAWTREEGVRIQDSPRTMREEISRCLKRNDVSGAANKTRHLYEAELADLCEAIRPQVEYRRGRSNERRGAPELLDSIRSHVNAGKTMRDRRDKQLFDDAKASTMVTNLGSHSQRLEAAGLSPGDIALAVEDLDSFLTMFKCPQCGKRVRRSSMDTQKLAVCECGALAV